MSQISGARETCASGRLKIEVSPQPKLDEETKREEHTAWANCAHVEGDDSPKG